MGLVILLEIVWKLVRNVVEFFFWKFLGNWSNTSLNKGSWNNYVVL